MKKLICITFLSVMICQTYSRNDTTILSVTNKPFRIELEPTSYIAKGWSLFCSYGINEKRNLHLGLYTIASTLPSELNERMFSNVSEEDEIRLTFELATSVRYKIPYNLKGETNPYIGLFFGWETFRHTLGTNQEETKLSNFFLTPQIGCEIYIFRQMIYLNPSVRLVYEFGKKSDYSSANPRDSGPEIHDWLWLPSFSIGIRL